MKFLCNSLYKELIPEKFYEEILFLSDEEMEHGDYDFSDIEGVIAQPFLINKKLLDKLPKARWVQITGAGYDRVDCNEVKSRDIILTNTRGVMSISIAEDVLAKILFFSREIRTIEKNKAEHKWDLFNQNQWMCQCYDDLYAKNIGIMGYGSIGAEVAKRARSFGMNVLAYGKSYRKAQEIDRFFTGEDELEQFYKLSDYIVAALPLTEETYHMIGLEAFSKMKTSAIFVNVARGAIVEESALLQALRIGRIRGAALDVFEKEPLPKESPFWDLPNILITPHKAGMGDSWKQRIGALIGNNIDRYLNGLNLLNIIDLRGSAANE